MLFKVFYVDGNSQWAHKFNHAIMNCHEKLGGDRSNYKDSQINNFVDLIVSIAENIEKNWNFSNEIQ